MTSQDAQVQENQDAKAPTEEAAAAGGQPTQQQTSKPASSGDVQAAGASKASVATCASSHADTVATAAPADKTQANSTSRLSRPIGKMPVEIRVELGVFEIAVEDAAAVKPGQVLKLTSDCPGQVKLLCRDHEIGRGELVDINGRLGVKILHNWCK